MSFVAFPLDFGPKMGSKIYLKVVKYFLASPRNSEYLFISFILPNRWSHLMNCVFSSTPHQKYKGSPYGGMADKLDSNIVVSPNSSHAIHSLSD